jgi:trehalose/maltose hydrolase-like predicted phosphorylase
LTLSASILANSTPLVMARGADESFILTATDSSFSRYVPTYLANGFWSADSSLLGTSATASQMAGLMDYHSEDVSRPVALPSWNEIDYFDGAAWLNASTVAASTHTHYRQTLDMHDGVLDTRYRWHSPAHATDVSVTSFVSQSAPHLAVVSLTVRPQFSSRVHVRFTLHPLPAPQRLPLAQMSAEQFSAAAAQANLPDLVSGGNRTPIWYPGSVQITGFGSDATSETVWIEGHAVGGRRVALAAAIETPPNLAVIHRTTEESASGVSLDLEVSLRRNHRYQFTKFVAASADGWGGRATDDVAAAIAARGTGLKSLRNDHSSAWHALWHSDIRVGGDLQLQRTIHSDLFYILENSTLDTSWPAAACGFSANYFGHIFWDNDFWVFPTLLLMHPARAKSLIEFRQRTLPQAQARAKAHGYAGAMYPWEADPWSGKDVTPSFAIGNADREIHVNGAVALAQWRYYLATQDLPWLREKGFPVLQAVADFWSSRVSFNAAKQRFELLHVTSPEEDYGDVDNEIYTNVVAHQSLMAAIDAARLLGIAPNVRWAMVADGLYLPTVGDQGAYFDFDPTTAHDKPGSWMATSVPLLSIPSLNFTADAPTLQGLYAHSVAAIDRVREHANQMILIMLAIQAADIGKSAAFSDFIGATVSGQDLFLKPPFNVRSETPQNNSNYLLATSGGFLQAFLYGLTGLRIQERGLVQEFPPTLPKNLTYLRLVNVAFRGQTFDVSILRLPSGRVVRQMTAKARYPS